MSETPRFTWKKKYDVIHKHMEFFIYNFTYN